MNVFTYNNITNLNWKLYGYIEINKHKDEWHQGKGFKRNFIQYIESLIQVSKDTHKSY